MLKVWINRKKTDQYSDSQLITEYKKSGDLFYLTVLFKRYSHLLFGLCMKYLRDTERAKDEVMHIYEALVDKLRENEIEDFKKWIYVLAKNHCLMILRQDRRDDNQKNNYQVFVEFEREVHPFEEQAFEDEEKVRKKLEEISTEQKQCIMLFYYNGLSYKSIAERTGFSLKEVKSHLQNGKRNLKNLMDRNFE